MAVMAMHVKCWGGCCDFVIPSVCDCEGGEGVAAWLRLLGKGGCITMCTSTDAWRSIAACPIAIQFSLVAQEGVPASTLVSV